jgi:lipoprotein
MRTTKLLSLLALVVFLACNVRAFAAAPDRKTTADGVQTLYIYGVSQNLNDTIAYVSDITVITGSHLLEKGYFLQRDQYADQFKDYVQKRFASPHQTTAVFFDTRIEAAEKRREKLRKHLAGSKAVLGTLTVKDVYKDQFVFKPIGQ